MTPVTQDETDELDLFGGRTMLLTTPLKQTSQSSRGKIPPTQLPITPSGYHPRYQQAPHHPHPSSVQNVGYNFGDAALGLPAEYEGLYREVSRPQYPQGSLLYGTPGQQGNLVLDDRWSSFMHNTALAPGHVTPQPH